MRFLRKLYPNAFKLKKKESRPFFTRIAILVVLEILIFIFLGAPAISLIGIISMIEEPVFLVLGYIFELSVLGFLVAIGIYLNVEILVSFLIFIGAIKNR